MKKKKTPLGFVEKMKRMKAAGLENADLKTRKTDRDDGMLPLPERISKLMGIVKPNELKAGQMIYFVMYDIESNKVRTQVVKYLQRKGLTRVQKSIFVGKTERIIYDQIREDLKAVQECYDNTDSIIMIPISTDEIRAMKLIGKNIDFDLALNNRNTLFF
ncbi:CRISPR-associated endonuclease Cas2 [Mangrovibacterium sp.]|uniref:CRISPR-associated endonuclease Cas2 n=1 Tax=Mangrovibacterium sp. TaxID=1961364 RepID=UPI00356734C5